jgi:hypothetical protein
LKKEQQDTLCQTDSQVYMYTRLYLEPGCRKQLERWNVGLKAFILAYDNICRIMINMRALAK